MFKSTAITFEKETLPCTLSNKIKIQRTCAFHTFPWCILAALKNNEVKKSNNFVFCSTIGVVQAQYKSFNLTPYQFFWHVTGSVFKEGPTHCECFIDQSLNAIERGSSGGGCVFTVFLEFMTPCKIHGLFVFLSKQFIVFKSCIYYCCYYYYFCFLFEFKFVFLDTSSSK